MPHGRGEEETESHVFDKVAKESDNSTASDHPMHKEGGDAKASAQDHKSKGPQISDNMPSVEGTKDELKAKAQAMNK